MISSRLMFAFVGWPDGLSEPVEDIFSSVLHLRYGIHLHLIIGFLSRFRRARDTRRPLPAIRGKPRSVIRWRIRVLH